MFCRLNIFLIQVWYTFSDSWTSIQIQMKSCKSLCIIIKWQSLSSPFNIKMEAYKEKMNSNYQIGSNITFLEIIAWWSAVKRTLVVFVFVFSSDICNKYACLCVCMYVCVMVCIKCMVFIVEHSASEVVNLDSGSCGSRRIMPALVCRCMNRD